MDGIQIQNILNRYGFQAGRVDGDMGPNTKAATARFQQATNIAWTVPDGIAGPETQRMLATLDITQGLLSAHFSYDELKCKHCGLCFVHRELLAAMEKLRAITGPLAVISAYRCPAHNAAIGGATNSMHVAGLAFDPPRLRLDLVLRAQAFTGIGLDRSGRVDHLDVRPGVATHPVTFYDAGTG